MTYSGDELSAFVIESNRIEGIIREPLPEELCAHGYLWGLPTIEVKHLQAFVSTVADARLRDRRGLDVRVGNHVPPRGGPAIRLALREVLANAHDPDQHPYTVHQAYESLHPFTDGNGRSGRALWAWQMLRQNRWPAIRLGFLRPFYYQALQHHRPEVAA